MFGKKKDSYELVKFSQDNEYRVNMLKGKHDYIVFIYNIHSKVVCTGGMIGLNEGEADREFNKQCYFLGIGKRACDE